MNNSLREELITVAVLILFLGTFSIFSSYFYMLEATGTFNWGRVLMQRVPSNLLWIILSPVFSILLFHFRISGKSTVGKILLGIGLLLLAAVHRIIAMLATNLLLNTTTIVSFWGDLFTQKFLFFSLWFDSIITGSIILAVLAILHIRRAAAEAEARQLQTEQLLIEARADNLKNSFHPHFLFNALHGISSVMYTNIHAADTMLMRLGNILRYGVHLGSKQFHFLDDELRMVTEYLEIQQLRFAQRFEYHLTTELPQQNILVPVFLIQPLAENAIKHAVEKTSERVRLTIAVTLQNNILSIRSENPVIHADHTTETGTGLTMLEKRLSLLYPNETNILSVTKNHLFTVLITLPVGTGNE